MSGFGVRKLGLGAAGVTALAVAVAGCSSGSGSNSVKPAAGASSKAAAAGSATSLKSRSTSIGTVLVDANGRTVYELVGDPASNPNCTGACLAIWPAVKVNGTQVVVNGHPAFTFVQDSAPGDTKGQNLKDQWGLWLALDASGNPIQPAASGSTAPASPSKAPNGGGAAF